MEPQQIVALDLGGAPAAGVSGPRLFQSDESTLLTFNLAPGDAGSAIVEFEQCILTRFGYPNDEARWGHAEYKGCGYGIYEVRNSAWLRELKEFNLVNFPNAAEWWGKDWKHFRFTFHDSTFECIARALKWETTREPLREVLKDRLGRMLGEE